MWKEIDCKRKGMDLRKAVGPFDMLFRNEVMFIALKGSYKLSHTNFFRKIALDERDMQSISQKLTQTVDIADDILPCLD